MSKWDDRFIRLAKEVATWSKDPSTQVGAVVTRPDNTIASVGFNGFPRGISDDPSLYADKEEKYARVIHAEVNAILNAKENVDGCSIYITHPCCSSCAGTIIQSGIREVVTIKPDQHLLLRWGKSIDRAVSMLAEAGVHYVETSDVEETKSSKLCCRRVVDSKVPAESS